MAGGFFNRRPQERANKRLDPAMEIPNIAG
jgi:hypothetical protein